MTQIRVLLWRHAPTPHNAAGRLQGRSDTDIGPDGLAKADLAAAEIIRRYGTELQVNTSPLRRASATAQALTKLLGGGAPQERAGLTQRSYGEWEGRTLEELALSNPVQLARRNAGLDPDIAGWETGVAVAARVGAEIETLVAQAGAPSSEKEKPTLVLASHGSALGMGLRHLLGLEPGDGRLGSIRHANWSEVVYTAESGTWSLLAHNTGLF